MILSDSAKSIFNSLHEGIVIIDTDAVIVFANNAYKSFVSSTSGVPMSKIEGVPLKTLRPGARLPEVLLTGQPYIQQERKETAEIYFVNMYPIKEGDTIIGAISVVTFLDDATNFRNKLDDLDRRNRQILHRVSESTHRHITFDDIVARSPKSVECKKFAMKIAGIESPILLMSEIGTGKDVYARAIHNASPRRKSVFSSINCANCDLKTLESELFGYEPGAFPNTGKHRKIGLFEATDGGTLFLDDISELNLDLQGKILHVIQEGSIRPIGAENEIPVDVRIIAASNVDLRQRIANGQFRAGLYYTLSTFCIVIPPLRERMSDIPLLAKQIVNETSVMFKKKLFLTDDAIAKMMEHDWPGNVRELRSVIEFAAYISNDGSITSQNIPENIGMKPEKNTTSLHERVKEFEKNEILKTLEFYGNDLAGKKAAAQELGISIASLYSKIK